MEKNMSNVQNSQAWSACTFGKRQITGFYICHGTEYLLQCM